MWSFIYFLLISKYIKYKYSISIRKQVFFIELLIEFISIYKQDILFFILFTILLTQSITDIINYDIYSILNIFLALFLILYKGLNISKYLTSITLPLILLIINKGIGLGDIEILFIEAIIFDIYKLSLIVFISSFINLIYALIRKNKYYPFVPFISMSTLLIYICIYY